MFIKVYIRYHRGPAKAEAARLGRPRIPVAEGY